MKKVLLMTLCIIAGLFSACKKDKETLTPITPAVKQAPTFKRDTTYPDKVLIVPYVDTILFSAEVDVKDALGMTPIGSNISFAFTGAFKPSDDLQNIYSVIKDGNTAVYTSEVLPTVSDGVTSFTQKAFPGFTPAKVYKVEVHGKVLASASDGGGIEDRSTVTFNLIYQSDGSAINKTLSVAGQTLTFALTPSSVLETAVASTTPLTDNVTGGQEVFLMDETLTSTGGTNTVNKKTYRFADPTVSSAVTMLKMYEGSAILGSATVTNGVAIFTNTFNVVTTKTVTVKAVVGSVNETVSGKSLKLISDKTEYTDIAGASKVNDIDRISNDQYVLRTIPTLKKESTPDFTITNGQSKEYYSYSLTFSGTGEGSQQQFTYSIRVVDPNVLDTPILKSFRVFEGGVDMTAQYRMTKKGVIDSVFTKSDTAVTFTKIGNGGETVFQAGISKIISVQATPYGFNGPGASVSIALIGDDIVPPSDAKFLSLGGVPNSAVKLSPVNGGTSSVVQKANYIFSDHSASISSANADNSTFDHYCAAVTGKPVLKGAGLDRNFFHN